VKAVDSFGDFEGFQEGDGAADDDFGDFTSST